jgi:hypothetical protein
MGISMFTLLLFINRKEVELTETRKGEGRGGNSPSTVNAL